MFDFLKMGAISKKVGVTVKPGEDPNYSFESDLLKGGELTFVNGGHDGFYVSFELADSTPQHYFPANAADALAVRKYVTPADACPDSGTWDQFKPKYVTDQLRTLVVRNLNSPGQACAFAFSLFVTTNSDGSPGPSGYLKLDPIGQNQDGPVQLNFAAAVAVVVGVAAVAGLVAYEFGAFG